MDSKKAKVILYKYKIYTKPKPPTTTMRNIQNIVYQIWHVNSNSQQYGNQQLLHVIASVKRGGASREPLSAGEIYGPDGLQGINVTNG